MKFDLAFLYVDLGNPWYKGAASEMIRSARRAYKDHDMRIVQIKDSKTEVHPDVDGAFGPGTDCSVEEMCRFKGYFMAELALQAPNPVVFCDVDMVWNNDKVLHRLVRHNMVGVMRHGGIPSMPFNSGLMVTTAGQEERQFWRQYQIACDSLPEELAAWWGDQVALTATVLLYRDLITPWKMSETAPAIDALPDKLLETPAVHFKGNRKPLMAPYARMLDRGAGFDFARPKPEKLDEIHLGFTPPTRAEFTF